MKAALLLAGVGVALSMTGYSMMRASWSSPRDSGLLLGSAIAVVGVVLIFVAAVRAAL